MITSEEPKENPVQAFSFDEINSLFRNKENLIYLFQLNGRFIRVSGSTKKYDFHDLFKGCVERRKAIAED